MACCTTAHTHHGQGEGLVSAKHLQGCLWGQALPIPLLPPGIWVRHKQAVLPVGVQYRHGIGLGHTGEVQKVGTRAVRIGNHSSHIN